MEPSKEPISVRVGKLNSQILAKTKPSDNPNILSREGLLDSLQLLYDECNTECLRNLDKNILHFVEKHKKLLTEIKQLRVNISDFEIKNVIGRGHFGEVHVVKEKQTGDVYAMKTIKKHQSLEDKNVAFQEERNIMAYGHSPWLTSLQYAFQDNANLYFIMEYHPGGDLLGLLYRQGGTLPESAASFYIAELVMALNDLHQMGYIHRDVKPDNLLLDRCGHLKLADFGSAAKLNSKGLLVNGVPVGTPDYIAPEVLQSMDNKNQKTYYGVSCDYWSVGIVAYELIIGNSPFTGNNTTTVYGKIMNHTQHLKFPTDIVLSQAYVSLVKGLITDQTNRLTFVKIIDHALFKKIDFSSLHEQVPPFVPKITSVDDTSNFSDIQVKKNQLNIENFKKKTQFSGKNLPFVGFTFTQELLDYSERYSNSIKVHDGAVGNLKTEIDSLQRKLLKSTDLVLEKDSLERKLEEKIRKLDSIESVRHNLEKDLANNIAECSALKRTLDLERKDRADLECKALDLIKSAKQKWEAAERVKLEAMNMELEQKVDEITQLCEENKSLQDHLSLAKKLEITHKVSLEKVEKLNRRSVLGLESRLEKVSAETDSQMTALATQLKQEINSKIDSHKQLNDTKNLNKELSIKIEAEEKKSYHLESKVTELNKHVLQLENELEASRNKSFALQIDNVKLDQQQEQINALNKQISTWKHDKEIIQGKFSNEQENCKVLLQEIENWKTELNCHKVQLKTRIEEQTKSYEQSVGKLQEEIKDLNDHNNYLEMKLQEAKRSDETNRAKVKTLEELLNRLESGIIKLENSSEREDVLQEQVERLEQQIVELHESSALEKQEMLQIKSKLWRCEKDLSNSDLDKKIVDRDLKEAQIANNKLKEDIDNLNLQKDASRQQYEKALVELSDLNEKMMSDILKLKDLNENLENEIETNRQNYNKEQNHVAQAKKEMEYKESHLNDVKVLLQNSEKDRDQQSRKLEKYQIDSQRLVQELESVKNERKNDIVARENCKIDLRKAQENIVGLQEACTLLEDQLIQFEKLQVDYETKQDASNHKIQQMLLDLAQAKINVQEAKKLANEEKSLKILAETKCMRVADENQSLQKDLQSYKKQCSEFKEYSNNLSGELNAMEEKLAEFTTSNKSYERQIKNCDSENNMLKEENSSQLTHLNQLKESNFSLNQNLMEAKLNNEILMEKLNELDNTFIDKINFYKERELKANSTIQQQTKLIDFLQSKIEELGKKKKTLSDKIFGNSKKENQPPLSIVLNYKDLETELKKEKESNRDLRQELYKYKTESCPRFDMTKIKRNLSVHTDEQKKILEQLVQSPNAQKNELYRQHSVQRMRHNIPHRFDSKLSTKITKCYQCSNQILLGRNMSVCRECNILVHASCCNAVPRTCGLPHAYAKHYTDSVMKITNTSKEGAQDAEEDINVQGWVKIPRRENNNWEKHYAQLTASTLKVFTSQPVPNMSPIDEIDLVPIDGQGKVILEPTASEIEVPVANSDLPFVLKVEVNSNSTCWPPKCVIFMALSAEDKEKWFKALESVLRPTQKYCGQKILELNEELDVNCIFDLPNGAKLLGTDKGLYSSNNDRLVHISGLANVHQIASVPNTNLALMIVDTHRMLIKCDAHHLENLSECASCSNPTLKFSVVNVNSLSGFHIFQSSDFSKHPMLCVATSKQIVIMKYDYKCQDFKPLRILDTAEPTSCILFTEHSLIIGANKFYEVDLVSFDADEFLDVSDLKLSHAIKCSSIGSFPLAIVQISKHPVEFLVCFKEFATFVDEFGRSSRNTDLKWNHLPLAFHYHAPYLYIVTFTTVEVIRINVNKSALNESFSCKISLDNLRYLGNGLRGVYVKTVDEIRLVEASSLDCDNISLTTISSEQNEESRESDRFSFTSSMVQSLDGNLSDVETDDNTGCIETHRKVQFSDL